MEYLVLNRIQIQTRFYCKISIKQLSNYVELDQEQLIKYIKKFIYQNKLSFVIDAKTGVIDTDSENISSQYKIDVLKETYENMNKIQKELINLDFKNQERKSKKIGTFDEDEYIREVIEKKYSNSKQFA